MFRPLDRPAVASPRPPQGGNKDDDVDVDGVSQIYFEENNLTLLQKVAKSHSKGRL